MPIDIIGKSTTQLTDAKGHTATPKPGDGPGDASGDARGGRDSSADTVSLTSTATKMRQLESSLENVPVVDIRHVSEVREQINRGTFQINPAQVAVKLMSHEFGIDLSSAA